MQWEFVWFCSASLRLGVVLRENQLIFIWVHCVCESVLEHRRADAPPSLSPSLPPSLPPSATGPRRAQAVRLRLALGDGSGIRRGHRRDLYYTEWHWAEMLLGAVRALSARQQWQTCGGESGGAVPGVAAAGRDAAPGEFTRNSPPRRTTSRSRYQISAVSGCTVSMWRCVQERVKLRDLVVLWGRL